MNTNSTNAAAAVASSPLLAEQTRTVEEVQAEFQPIVNQYQEWQNVPGTPSCTRSLLLTMARVTFTLLSNGSFPQRLSAAWQSLNLFAQKLVRVLANDDEIVDGRGNPRQSFWMAFDNVVGAMKVKPIVRRNPKLERLMDEFAGDLRRDQHIAREYGWLDRSGEEPIWRGPFFRPNGTVDSPVIQRELKEPGSVVPAEFDPDAARPAQVIELQPVSAGVLDGLRKHLELEGGLKAEVHVDPASVEDLLQQGQYCGVIARVKGIPESEVRQIAAELGIRPAESSDVLPAADLFGPIDQIYRSEMLSLDRVEALKDSGSSQRAPSSTPAEESESPSSSNEAAGVVPVSSVGPNLDDALREILERDPETDTPRAMQNLKQQGIPATGPEVGRKLAALRQQMMAAAK